MIIMFMMNSHTVIFHSSTKLSIVTSNNSCRGDTDSISIYMYTPIYIYIYVYNIYIYIYIYAMYICI